MNEQMEKRVGQYVEVRDAMERLKKKQEDERKPLQQMLDALAALLQKFMENNGITEGLRTKAGSCYLSTRYTATVADPDAFMKFVIENKLFDLLDRRANATAVRDYVKEHNTLPTGVNLNALQSVGVRRPTGKSKED